MVKQNSRGLLPGLRVKYHSPRLSVVVSGNVGTKEKKRRLRRSRRRWRFDPRSIPRHRVPLSGTFLVDSPRAEAGLKPLMHCRAASSNASSASSITTQWGRCNSIRVHTKRIGLLDNELKNTAVINIGRSATNDHFFSRILRLIKEPPGNCFMPHLSACGFGRTAEALGSSAG